MGNVVFQGQEMLLRDVSQIDARMTPRSDAVDLTLSDHRPLNQMVATQQIMKEFVFVRVPHVSSIRMPNNIFRTILLHHLLGTTGTAAG